MWNFFSYICKLILNEDESLYMILPEAIVPLLNCIQKGANEIANGLQIEGCTCIDIILQVVKKILETSNLKKDEFEAINAIHILICLLENIP